MAMILVGDRDGSLARPPLFLAARLRAPDCTSWYRGARFFGKNRFIGKKIGVEIAASCCKLCGLNFEGMKVHMFSFHFVKSPYSKPNYAWTSQGAKLAIFAKFAVFPATNVQLRTLRNLDVFVL